jgi:hypothetical protein
MSKVKFFLQFLLHTPHQGTSSVLSRTIDGARVAEKMAKKMKKNEKLIEISVKEICIVVSEFDLFS